MRQINRPRIAPRLFVALMLGALGWGAADLTGSAFGQEPKSGAKPADPSAKEAADKADQALKAAEADKGSVFKKESPTAAAPMPAIDWFDMIRNGGPLMIPIG